MIVERDSIFTGMCLRAVAPTLRSMLIRLLTRCVKLSMFRILHTGPPVQLCFVALLKGFGQDRRRGIATMHLAEIAGLKTAQHSLIRLADDSLGYLTRRMDRDAKGYKLPMEDFCQLTERQTEYKYRSSSEQVAKAITGYSTIPQLDVINYYEEVIFCWLTGNNDMHLKNFSLLSPSRSRHELSPAYDLLNVAIVNPADTEELALTLNGKKKRITRKDFIEAASKAGISEKIIDGLVAHFEQCWPKWEAKIDESFLSEGMKEQYKLLILNRMKRIL